MAKMTTALCIAHFIARAQVIDLVGKRIIPFLFGDLDELSQDEISDMLEEYKVNTLDEAKEKVAKLFHDSKSWKRTEKYKVDADDYFGVDEGEEADIKKFAGQKVVCRLFFARGLLGDVQDNFRIEVYTDPTDSKVVAWGLVTD